VTATPLIRQARPGDAEDTGLVARIVGIINQAYFWSEAEQWIADKERTNNAEIEALLAAGELLLAFAADELSGVVAIKLRDPTLAEFGMLASASESRSTGIGGSLVDAAEDWARGQGRSQMEIEIVRAEPPNAHKRQLHDWYLRLGYELDATYPLAARWPELVPLQAQTCVSTVYRKRLV